MEQFVDSCQLMVKFTFSKGVDFCASKKDGIVYTALHLKNSIIICDTASENLCLRSGIFYIEILIN